jgi:RND superfamily putative drug exporter
VAPPDDERRRRWARVLGGVGILWLLVGLFGGSFEGKLADVQKNDSSAYLPSSAESTEVTGELRAFDPVTTTPGFVVYYREGGLTRADARAIDRAAERISGVAGVDRRLAGGVRRSADGAAAAVAAPLVARRGGQEVDAKTLVDVEDDVLDAARHDLPPGLVAHSAGPAGFLVATIDAFSGLESTLLLVAGAVVIVILLLVYRSPVLWIVPVVSAVLAIGASALIIYPLAKHDVLTLNGQSQGILSVLIFGAGTDYALLMISRYREELHAHRARLDAMIAAWRGAAPAIAASAATVILGLLCLTVSELNSDASLGPVCAIGIGCVAAIMLTFLPVALLAGRWLFWPRVPRVDASADLATRGAWARFATGLGRRARRTWIITTIVLLVAAGAIAQLDAGGLSSAEQFTSTPDAVAGQRLVTEHFGEVDVAPATIIANADRADAVIAAVRRVPGVSDSPGAVCVQPDVRRLAAASPRASPGCAPPRLRTDPVQGRMPIEAQLASPYDSQRAIVTVTDIREAVHDVPAADAIVGGQSATILDARNASAHDRNLVIPIVLVVVFLVLCVLLRALLVPLLLVATVVLSFTATLGVSALAFNHVFGFAATDPGFPLFAFVFLVALGVDYNIFLMTRVREESLRHGTREGIRRGLAVTGAVITSAGVVLAATFAVLGVVPLVALAEVGFAVAFGVLLDTFVVRSLLVPALGYDLGRLIWWPSQLARGHPVRPARRRRGRSRR